MELSTNDTRAAEIICELRTRALDKFGTIQAAADAAGMKRQLLSLYLNGGKTPGLPALIRIAETVGAKIEVTWKPQRQNRAGA